MSALGLEETRFGQFVFNHSQTAFTYLGLQVLADLAALAACLMTLVRGPSSHRLIVAIPTVLLVLYALIAIGGPG